MCRDILGDLSHLWFVLTIVSVCLVQSVHAFDETQWVPVYQYRNSFRTTSFNVRGSAVPYWTFGGDAVVTEDFVRLTGTEKSRKGYLWNTMAVTYPDWMVVLTIKISPNAEAPQRLGADGMAFWYTQERMEEGPVFGNRDRWNGLAITFDTFDNDGKRDNPFVAALVNDGTHSYDKGQDGKNLIISGCQINYRGVMLKVKIIYFHKTLELWYDTSSQPIEETTSWTKCFSIPNLQLPPTGYFGLSAETGDLFDNHDVYSLSTYRLLDTKAQEKEAEESRKWEQQQQQVSPQEQQTVAELSQKQQQQQQQQQQQPQETMNTAPTPQQTTPQKPKTSLEEIQETLKRDLEEETRRSAKKVPDEANVNTTPRPQSRSDASTPEKVPRETMESLTDLRLLERLLTLENQVDSVSKQITALKQSQLSLTQAITDLQGTLPVKSDLNTLSRGFQDTEQKIINQLRHEVTQLDNKLNSLSQGDQNSANEIKQTLRTLLNTVDRIRTVVEGSNTNAQNLMNTLERSKQEISQLVESRTSYGFWIFFLFFQVEATLEC
jgi:mannose-binding lectin 1